MRTSASAWLAGAGVALAALAIPAIGQDRPESILPPGFSDPVAPTPAPTAAATGAAGGSAPSAVTGNTGLTVQPLPSGTPTGTPSAAPTIDPAVLAEYELPAFARRSLASVGAITSADGGLPANAFGRADGGYLEGLMRRVGAPLPSRWLSIALRRALVSELDTPDRLNGADFAAERAWLLLRMGEATAARAVVQGVDTGNYTPKLYQVAMQAMLANGDPAGLCPLLPTAASADPGRGWTLAGAMCASLSGNGAQSRTLLTQARRRNVASGVDLLLAQKVVGAQGGQAVTIEWDAVPQLTTWRYGLAVATGVAVPDALIGTVQPQLRLWQALAPGIAPADRVAAAEAAAGQGVLSNLAMVDLYGAIEGDDDASGSAVATARDLREAYVGATTAARLQAIRTLWGSGEAVPYGRLVLTARAAARIVPSADTAEAPRLIAAMLTAGLDTLAMRWRGVVPADGDAWAMLALADPNGGGRLGYSDLAGYSGTGNAALKQRMLFAGLAGLGRLAPGDVERAAQALDVRIGAENAWTRALDRAARDNQPATVLLLAAAGMQTGSWRGVPPEHLYRIVGALRATGLAGEARMIAAEAIARL